MGDSQSGWIHTLVSKVGDLWRWLRSLSSTAKYLVLLLSLETLTWTPAFWGEGAAPQPGIQWEVPDGVRPFSVISA